MKNLNLIKMVALLLAFISVSTSCKKFLDEKSDKRLLIPVNMVQLQALLDNYSVMSAGYCSAGELSADDYYLTTADYNALTSDFDKRTYIWERDNLFAPGTSTNNWSMTYSAIYTANAVLDGLVNIEVSPSNQSEYNNLKGQALFFRGSHLLDGSFIWTPVFNAASAKSDLGMPIRNTTDFNVPSTRSTMHETYNQIINDLKASIPCLPLNQISPFRPAKAAAYGLLARTYLIQGNYTQAVKYADSCLLLKGQLLDYNTLTATQPYPIKLNNVEVLFYGIQQFSYALYTNTPKVDSQLYNSYSNNDLRKTVFFTNNTDGTHSFKGSYNGDYSLFAGIGVDEILLTRAECFARIGDLQKGIADLNTVLVKRFRTGTFVPFVAGTATETVSLILVERRKELLMRGLRWIDIKRLNRDGANISLMRSINNQNYTLPTNDLRFALPIPKDIIDNSNLVQNPR